MRLREWLSGPNGLKLVALVLATFTWLFVKAVTSDSRTVEGVPLEIRTPPGLVVAHASAQTVTVTVRGAAEDLRAASRNELYAVLDLSHVTAPAELELPIETRFIRHPRRVQVTAVEPARVTVRLRRNGS
jgi:YbbR domain-containing protein